MIKTTILISAALFGAIAAGGQVSSAQVSDIATDPAIAEQTMIPLPQADTVIAQFSYLELSHDADGFSLSVTEKTAVFVDLEFPGEVHIRIGF